MKMKAFAGEDIQKCIHVIRDRKVMLDSDLARLYRVSVREVLLAVKRNPKRFPPDFAFTLNATEAGRLGSGKRPGRPRSGRRRLPVAFTGAGAAMLSTVLKSKAAIHTNIRIVRMQALGVSEADRLRGQEHENVVRLAAAFGDLIVKALKKVEKARATAGSKK